MSLSDMKERRLTELHDRWLLVFKQFPIVCHCAARQHGPVTIYEHTEGLDGARSAIGEIEFDVYCPKTHYRASPMPSNVVFASQERELAFGQSLYRAFWGASALRSLTMQDRVPSLIHFDEAPPIEFPNESGKWFGYCAFERAWDDSVGPSDWLEQVGSLASESLALCIDFSSGSLDHSRPLEKWLSYVYQWLNVEVSPSEIVKTFCIDMAGATITSSEEDRTIPDQRWRVGAEVLTSRLWLPLDVCTASAMAIERIVSGGSDPMDANNSQTKRGRGRPKGSTRTDKKCDKQLYEAWGSGGYKTKKDVDDEFSLPHGSTFDAYERHRKTLYNEKKRVHGEK